MPPRLHVVLDEHGQKKLVRWPLGGFHTAPAPPLDAVDPVLIEKIRLTGRLAHGAFGDDYVTNWWNVDQSARLARVFELVQGEHLDEETEEESAARRHRLVMRMQAVAQRRSAAARRACEQREAMQKARREASREWQQQQRDAIRVAKIRERRWQREQEFWQSIERGCYSGEGPGEDALADSDFERDLV